MSKKRNPLPDLKPKDNRKSFQVSEPIELMDFLKLSFPDKSRTAVKSYLIHRQVYVNNQIITQYNHRLKPLDVVLISETKIPTSKEFVGLTILYEDDYVIVIDKASGLLSIATASEKDNTAYSQLRNYVKNVNERNKLFILHRLDKDTSGVMMFAKSAEIQEEMQKNWQRYVTKRTYLAVLEGAVEKDSGSISSWIFEDQAHKMESNEEQKGRQAVTHFKVVKRKENFTLVEFELDTGRKNQIRVHAQSMGHPIVGDRKYGGNPSPFGRLGLHANILEFIHPVFQTSMQFKSPMPFRMFRR
ncbi:MAG: RluA family pseudouridine synthase [Bacteroidales bacterium]|nr:RluA family pseudouridine synthase [Bacteroidales bacterium]